MEDGFRAKNAFNYLLVLRLVPVFPFFLVNLAAGLLGVRLGTYVLATAARHHSRHASSMPGSATGWARSSMPAARPISA